MKGFKKFISVVGLTSSLLMGGVSVQGGNTFSSGKSQPINAKSTQTEQKLGRVVKLEPFYLACVLNHLKIPFGDFELKTLQNFEQVSKDAAEAMKMVRRFDFNSKNYCSFTSKYYNKTTQNIVKLYPNLETVGCRLCDIGSYNQSNMVASIIPVLKKGGGVKHLDLWWYDEYDPHTYLHNAKYVLSWTGVDFSGMTIDSHAHFPCWYLSSLRRDGYFDVEMCLDAVREYLNDPNSTVIGCIYVKFSEDDVPFLDEIQQLFPGVKIFQMNLYDRYQKFCDGYGVPSCTFYIKYRTTT